MARTYVIGTRGSKLALRQVEIVRALLEAAHPGVSIDVREIKTEGDGTAAPLSEIGGLGVFTKAIEDALLAGACDIAVHSLKDLPTELAPGLTLAAVPERDDPRDALVTRDGRTLADLPAGARIGIGSGRRAVALKALRADIETAEIRGNVDTRIRKVDEGAYDGAVLAMAGLRRLGLEHRASQIFSVHEMVPAVGQAALGIETRADDAQAIVLVAAIEHADTRVCVEAERAFLRRLGAGCRLPVGAYGELRDGTLHVSAMIGDESGSILHAKDASHSDDAAAPGTRLAERMMADSGVSFAAPAAERTT